MMGQARAGRAEMSRECRRRRPWWRGGWVTLGWMQRRQQRRCIGALVAARGQEEQEVQAGRPGDGAGLLGYWGNRGIGYFYCGAPVMPY